MAQVDIKLWLSSGVFAIRHVETGEMFICGSLCMLNSLVRHVGQINLGHSSVRGFNGQLDKLEYLVLETNISENLIKLRTQHYIDLYQDVVLNKKQALKYVVHIEFVSGKVHVFLKSRNRSTILVGVFRKLKEANEFVERNYKEGVKDIIYSNNLLTRAFRKGEKDA